MNTSLEQFKQHLIRSHMSENTVKAYASTVSLYYKICGEALNSNNVTKFKRHLETQYKPTTANLRVIAFNRFLTFVKRSKLKMKMVKNVQKKYLDEMISYSDYLKFKECLHKEKEQKWYFIVWTMAATGMRVSEVTKLHVENIHDGQMDVRSKGNKIRRVYFPNSIIVAMTAWLSAQGRLSGPLFLNNDGKAISIRGIAKGLERHATRYGIDKHLVHPHAFRHLFARKFLESRNDLTMLADLLGHESLDTTKIYLRMTSQEQHDIIDRIVEW